MLSGVGSLKRLERFPEAPWPRRMNEVLRKAVGAFGAPVKVGDHLTAEYREAMGRIPCPFGDGVFPKGEVELTDSRSGRTIRMTPLSVHMIGAHRFYQGAGSRYRTEPAELCGILDIPTGPEAGRPRLGL